MERRSADAPLDATAATEPSARGIDALPSDAPRIGRYAVLRRLGEGGMGVVLAGYDEQLNRRVAIKLLKGDVEGSVRARMLREGQAMARLSHPNIVPVFEVGEHAGGLFLAMELIEGDTLRQWHRESSPGWREVLGVYVQAARGLAAAHDAGLLHRDFKPDNAIIGEDGRVRVLDFGLARAMDDPTAPAPSLMPGPGSDAFAEKLTQAGSTLGTPAYMAPEQFLGEPTDARTDVFAFCVALFEALYGQRPFRGATRYELALAITEGQLSAPPSGHDVPPWLHQVVVRGLEPTPDERPASMRELLERIDIDPDRRKKQMLGGLALVGVAGSAAFAGFVGGNEAAPEPCAGLQRRLEGVWDDNRRAAVRAAFARQDVPWQTDAFGPVEAALDDHGARLVGALEEACRATRITAEQSEAVLDLRTACVGERIRAMGALTHVLTDADATAIALAPDAVASLPDPDLCADATLLTAGMPIPDDEGQRARIDGIRGQLAEAQAHLSVGRARASEALAQAAIQAAVETDYAPVSAEASLVHGRSLTVLGRFDEARVALSRAVDLAEPVRHDEAAARAWVDLYYLAHAAAPDPARLDDWGRRAVAAVARIDDPPEIRQRLAVQLSLRAMDAGDLERAQVLVDEVAALGEAAGPSSSADYLRRRLAVTRGDSEAALAYHRRELDQLREQLGPAHPFVGRAANDLGLTLVSLGRPEEAIPRLQEAIDVRTAAFGETHAELGRSWLAMGSAALSLGRLQDAKAAMLSAAEAIEGSVGPQHPAVAEARNALGVIAFFEGDLQAAADQTRRALSIFEAAYPEDRAETANTAANLGEYLLHLGELDEARTHLERAATMMERTLGPRHPDQALPLKLLGFVALLEGKPAAAVEPLRRSAELVAPGRPYERADALAALAIALWPAQPDAARAVAADPRVAATDDAGRQRRRALIDLLETHERTFTTLELKAETQ